MSALEVVETIHTRRGDLRVVMFIDDDRTLYRNTIAARIILGCAKLPEYCTGEKTEAPYIMHDERAGRFDYTFREDWPTP